jgi:hypothetical protein
MSEPVDNDRSSCGKDGEIREDADKDGSPRAAPPDEKAGAHAGAGPEADPGAEAASGDRPEADAGTQAASGDRAEADVGPRPDAKAEEDPKGRPRADGDLPATFATLIIGLATTAMMQLEGQSPDGSRAPKPDLAAAKHYIDILAELERKTKGNLTEEEGNMLKGFLYDLRLRYVQLS